MIESIKYFCPKKKQYAIWLDGYTAGNRAVMSLKVLQNDRKGLGLYMLLMNMEIKMQFMIRLYESPDSLNSSNDRNYSILLISIDCEWSFYLSLS